jgi:two-component system NtrC family sensor kinase
MPSQSIIYRLEERMKKYRLPRMPVIWGVTCLVIGILIAVGLYSYSSAEKAMVAQFNQQQLVLARQAAQGMEGYLGNLRQTLTLLTRIPEIQKPEKKGTGPRGEAALRVLGEQLGGSVDFWFRVDDRGNMISSYPAKTLEDMAGKGFDFAPYFRKARTTGNPSLVPVRPSAGDRSQSSRFGFLLLLSPVFRGSELAGFLGAGIDFKKLYARFVHPIASGTRGASWMIDQEGKFLAHDDPNFLGKTAFSARKERDPGLSSEQIDRIMKEEMIAGHSGTGEYTSGWHLGEQGRIRKLIAYAPVHLGDQVWSVAVVVPHSEVTRLVWGRFRISAILILVMASTLLAGAYVGHKINQERIRAAEKVKWSEEILRSQNRLQALFDGAPDAIAIVDRDYRILTVNKTALNWYRRSMEDFVGRPCHQEFQKRPDLCVNCPAEESFRTGRPAFRERASLVAGGNKYYLQIFTFPLRGRNGEVAEVVEYVKDVTAEKELQRQIIQSERMAVVGRMAANVAHEIKNPLGTIVLNAELLDEELDKMGPDRTAEARELLTVIKSEVDRLLEVVEEYLQFARLPKIKLEEGNPNEVISDLLLFLREDVAERKILLEEDLDPRLPALQLDPKQLRQAFLNILKNSFEAMPEGGKLTVSTAQRDGKAEITFGDTGKGIPEESQDLIFTPFFSTKHGGTGLGLPITSHIVKEHRGTIHFESYEGLGTSFIIRLPIPPVPGPVSGEEKQNGRPGADRIGES